MDQELYNLINKAKYRDEEAYIKLIRRYKGFVFKHAYGMLNNRTEAEDITQEVFLKVYNSLNKLENTAAFTSWLARIVSNMCYDRLRKLKQEKKVLKRWINNNLPEQEVDDNVDRKQMRLNIEEAMQELSVDHREVILLRDLQGFSYAEIAEIMGIPEGTVKSRIYTARKILRKQLSG